MSQVDKINSLLDKHLSKKFDKSLLQVLVFSEKNQIDIKRSSIEPDQPFHVASIGKMFTATIIGILAESRLLTIGDKIAKYLSTDVLGNLFTYKGTDYSGQITIRQLLGHTSGVADYFEDKVKRGDKFVDFILKNPDKKWTPRELLDFTRNNQKPHGSPGEFHYSDTGYVLLGLLIEKVTGKAFHEVLADKIFAPLGMTNSYLMFYDQREQHIAPVWFNGHEVSQKNILSCDWAGGGIVSTIDDLLKFQKAYWKGELVGQQFIGEMSHTANRIRPGMHYGLGMTELRFEGFFFLLSGLPRPKGHSGILGTFMLYDADNDTHIILNMGSNKKIPAGIRLIIQIESMLKALFLARNNT